MPGGVGYFWFEVEVVSYDVPIEVPAAGGVLVLDSPDSLIVAFAPSVNLGVTPAASVNLRVAELPPSTISLVVSPSDNLRVSAPPSANLLAASQQPSANLGVRVLDEESTP